jgi:hypothetical protein
MIDALPRGKLFYCSQLYSEERDRKPTATMRVKITDAGWQALQ